MGRGGRRSGHQGRALEGIVGMPAPSSALTPGVSVPATLGWQGMASLWAVGGHLWNAGQKNLFCSRVDVSRSTCCRCVNTGAPEEKQVISPCSVVFLPEKQG